MGNCCLTALFFAPFENSEIPCAESEREQTERCKRKDENSLFRSRKEPLEGWRARFRRRHLQLAGNLGDRLWPTAGILRQTCRNRVFPNFWNQRRFDIEFLPPLRHRKSNSFVNLPVNVTGIKRRFAREQIV